MSVKFSELLLSLVCTLNHPILPMYFIPPSLVNAVTLITVSVTLPNQIKLAQDRSMRINSFCVPRCWQDLILCLPRSYKYEKLWNRQTGRHVFQPGVAHAPGQAWLRKQARSRLISAAQSTSVFYPWDLLLGRHAECFCFSFHFDFRDQN